MTNITIEESIQPFLSEPWCVQLIRDPDYIVEVPSSRVPKPTTREDEFFSSIINNSYCMPGMLCLNKKPTKPDGVVEETITLFAIGHGINGHPNVAHGGMIAAMLDEGIGAALQANLHDGAWGLQKAMTKYLNVTYMRPMRTPGVVQCRVKLDKVEAKRKFFYTGFMQDGEGNNLAKGEALFLPAKEKL